MTRVVTEMTQKVMFALEKDQLADVWVSMLSLGVRHVPVVREEKVVGIISDRDILLLGRPEKGGKLSLPAKTMEEVMTREVISCGVGDSIGKVAATMVKERIDALPVVTEKGKLIGIITSTDLLRLLQNRDGDLTKELPFRWEVQSLLGARPWRPATA
jgi:CBS domain-containing protein